MRQIRNTCIPLVLLASLSSIGCQQIPDDTRVTVAKLSDVYSAAIESWADLIEADVIEPDSQIHLRFTSAQREAGRLLDAAAEALRQNEEVDIQTLRSKIATLTAMVTAQDS